MRAGEQMRYVCYPKQTYWVRNPSRAVVVDGNPDHQTTTEDRLGILASELRERSSNFFPVQGLVFRLPPQADAQVPPSPLMDPNDLNLHRLSLTDAPINTPITNYERWLLRAKEEVTRDGGRPTLGLSREIEQEFLRLQSEKITEWLRQQEHAQLLGCMDDLEAMITRPRSCTTVDTGEAFQPLHDWRRAEGEQEDSLHETIPNLTPYYSPVTSSWRHFIWFADYP